MTNKLVVVIKCLKVPNIKKILLYEMKFRVPNYSLPPEPLTRGLTPTDPRSLCPLSSTEFVDPPPEKIPGYATALFPIYWSWVGSRAYLDVSEMKKILCSCRYSNLGSSRPVSPKLFFSRILTYIIAHVDTRGSQYVSGLMS